MNAAFSRNDAGLTPLHWAAQYSAAASVAPLVDAGADLEAHDKHGWTPLRWAIAAGACQSASKIDPLSACNIDPLSGTAEVVSVVNRGDPSGFV